MQTGAANLGIANQAKVSIGKLTVNGGSIDAPANIIGDVEVKGELILNAPVQTVTVADGIGLYLGETAAVQTLEVLGDLKLSGSGSAASIDVQSGNAQIEVSEDDTPQIAQVMAGIGIARNIKLVGLDTAVQIKSAKPTSVKANASEEANGNGKLTGVNDTMEYKKATGSECSGIDEGKTTVDDLNSGTYLVRVKAGENVLVGEAVTVTIFEAINMMTLKNAVGKIGIKLRLAQSQ